jgi:hypothetical protein
MLVSSTFWFHTKEKTFWLDDRPLAAHKVPYFMEFANFICYSTHPTAHRYPRCSFIYIPFVWPLLQINTPVRILGPRLQPASSSLSVMYTWARKGSIPSCACNRSASLLSSGLIKWNTEEINQTESELFEYYSINPKQNMTGFCPFTLVRIGISTKISIDFSGVHFTHTGFINMTF